MKHKIILFLAAMLLAATCVGCGNQPHNDDILLDHQEQDTNLPSVKVPETNPSVENVENPAAGDGLFEISKANGTVVEFSDTGCKITPTHYDGNVAYEAAPGYEDQDESISVLYSQDCVFQIAYVNIQTGEVTYVSCLVPGQERFTRLKTLGADYTEEAIRERIEGKRTRTAKAPKTERGVSLLIDIENSIKAAQSRGYEQWAKIHNLKQAAKTMNFITEHKIEQYADLTAKIAEIQTESEQSADALKSVEKRLADMAVLIKNVSTLQKTKPAYDAYRKARNKDSYRAAHEREIILHEAAVV